MAVTIPYVRDFDFAYGRSDVVSPNIRRVIANNPGPFTYLGTGTYIVGRGEVAVIDPGPDLPEHLDALLEALKGETVSHILVTHHHLDHSPLARPLAEATGAVTPLKVTVFWLGVGLTPVPEIVTVALRQRDQRRGHVRP